MFGPDLGVLEDSATGSATGPLASSHSILHVAIDGDAIEVGGHVAPVANGQFTV